MSKYQATDEYYYPPVAPPPDFQHQEVRSSPPVTYTPVLGPHPQTVQCPSCRTTVVTRMESETSQRTHLNAALLCLAGCCCIPYMIDSCKDRNHYCPHCQAYIGTHK